MEEDNPKTEKTRLHRILTAILFTTVSAVLLGATFYWSLSKGSACAVKPELITEVVSITVIPKGALVVIDNDTISQAELTEVKLSVGVHHVFASRKDYHDLKDSIVVREGINEPVLFELIKIPIAPPPLRYAVLVIRSAQPGASVYIKDRFVGPTEYTNTMLPGTYKIDVRTVDQKHTWEKVISLAADMERVIAIDFSQTVRVPIRALDSNGGPLAADVYVDGNTWKDPNLGTPVRTPTDVIFSIGVHTISVQKDGYDLSGKPVTRNFEQSTTQPTIKLRMARRGNQ